MFSLSPHTTASVRYYVSTSSQEKSALRSRRRARRASLRHRQRQLEQ